MKIYRIQFAPATDNIVDGMELTKLPYPFFIREDGKVQNQDLWKGDPYRVLGFQFDLARQQIDFDWRGYVNVGLPEMVKGRYLVTQDVKGGIGVHTHAIDSIEVWEGLGA